MIAALLRLFMRPRKPPPPFARLARSPSLAQIKAWNRERLDLNPALRRSC